MSFSALGVIRIRSPQKCDSFFTPPADPHVSALAHLPLAGVRLRIRIFTMRSSIYLLYQPGRGSGLHDVMASLTFSNTFRQNSTSFATNSFYASENKFL